MMCFYCLLYKAYCGFFYKWATTSRVYYFSVVIGVHRYDSINTTIHLGTYDRSISWIVLLMVLSLGVTAAEIGSMVINRRA